MKSTKTCFSKVSSRLAIVGLAAIMFAAAGRAQDARGKQLYANCVACHKDDGSGQKLLNAPSIAGMPDWYVKAQIEKFKAGHRGGDPRDSTGMQMRPMTLTLQTPEDVAAVSTYVASLEPVAHEPTIEGGDPERGKMLYATCQACHGADGKGNEALKAPPIANQYDWYLVAQLHKFKDGVRGSNPEDVTGSQMRPMAMTLVDDQAVKDVVAYIETLSAK